MNLFKFVLTRAPSLKETARKEMRERMAKQKRERQFGLTSDKKSYVDAALVAQLTDGGFSRGKVIRSVPWAVIVMRKTASIL